MGEVGTVIYNKGDFNNNLSLALNDLDLMYESSMDYYDAQLKLLKLKIKKFRRKHIRSNKTFGGWKIRR